MRWNDKIFFVGILAREDYFYRNRCPPRGMSVPWPLTCACLTSAQTVKDVIASYEALVNLFERIRFFLQRLNHYTTVPLTPEMTLLLGKIMAQVLSVLALSTKEMKERRISASICLVFSFMADYATEKFMKRIVRRTEVEDALSRLDMLTKEENLMTAARNLEVTQNIHDDVRVTKHGAQHSTSHIHLPINLCRSYLEIAMDEQQRLLFTVLPSSIVIAEPCTQVNRCRLTFGRGYLPRIPPSIIILHATSNTKVLQCGLSKVTNSTSGRRKVHYCGSVVIVSVFPPSQPFMAVNVFLDLLAGSGKSILWCVIL